MVEQKTEAWLEQAHREKRFQDIYDADRAGALQNLLNGKSDADVAAEQAASLMAARQQQAVGQVDAVRKVLVEFGIPGAENFGR